MTSIVELGIEIKTDSVVKAADDLDSLTDAGKGAEGAAKQIESSWAKAMTGLRGDTSQIVKELQALNATQSGIAQQMIAMGRAATDASSGFGVAAKAQAALTTSTESAAQAGQKMVESAEQQSARLAAVVKASLEASQYHQSLTNAVNGTSSAMDSAGKSATDWARYQAEINAKGQALLATEERLAQEAKKAAAATDLQADGLQKLLGQIDPAVAALDRLDEQQARLAKYKAAGLLDTETFRDYSAKIDQTRQKLGGFDDGLKTTETTSKQTKAALAQLPAQFTDIFTSLIGGQSPFTVLIQQGGQIKDSFGGIGPMLDALAEKANSFLGLTSATGALGDAVGGLGDGAKAAADGADAAGESLGDMAEGANTAADAAKNAKEATAALSGATPPLASVMGLVVGTLAAAAATAVALGVAYKDGSSEASEYNKALAMTGNTAGTSADQLSDIARAVSEANGTVHEAGASLALLAGSTKITVDQFQLIATAAANFEDATDTAASKTVANFEKIAKEPTKAIIQLNESMNFLTTSTLEQIRSLEKQGKTQEAATLANQVYADAMNRVADRVNANLGTIERGWKHVKDAAKGAWDSMLNIGREDTFSQRIAEIDSRIQDLKDENETLGKIPLGLGSVRQKYNNAEIERQETLKTQALIGQEESRRRAAAKGEIGQARADAIEAETAISKIREDTQTNAQKREKEIAEYRRNIEKIRKENPTSGLLDEKKITQDIANIREKWADKKGPSTTAPLDLRSFNDAENALKSLNSTYENSMRVLDAAQKAGAISQSEYTEQKSALLAKQKTDVQAAYQVEINALESLKGSSKLSAAQRIELDNKITDAKQKQTDTLKKLSADQEILTKETEGQLKRQEAAFKAFALSVDDSLALAQRGLEQQLAGFGMGQEARRRLQEDLKIREDYQKKLEQLARDFNKIEKPSEEQKALYDKETGYLKDALEKRLNMQEDYYRKLEAAQANWKNGANAAWQDYIDEASDIAGQTYDVFSNAFAGLEDVLVDFAMTGKLTFKDFANSVIADIARIIVRTQIVTPLLNAFFGGSSGGGLGLLAGAAALFGGSSGSSSSSGGSSLGSAGGILNMASTAYSVATGVGPAVSAGWASGGVTGAIQGGIGYYTGVFSSAASTLSSTFASLTGAITGNTAAIGATQAGYTGAAFANWVVANGGTAAMVPGSAAAGTAATAGAGTASMAWLGPLAIALGMWQSGKLYDQGVRYDTSDMQTSDLSKLGRALPGPVGFDRALTFASIGVADRTLSKVFGGKMGAILSGSTFAAAIEGFIGSKLFGTDWATKDTGIALSVTDGEFTPEDFAYQKKKGGLFGSNKKRTLYSEMQDSEMANTLGTAYNATVLSAMDLFGALNVTLNEAVLDGLNVAKVSISTQGREQAEIQAEIDAWFTTLADSAVAAITDATGADLKGLTFGNVQTLVNNLYSVNGIIDHLGAGLFQLSVQGSFFADQLQAMAGGLEAFQTLSATYQEGFLTEGERNSNMLKDLRAQFTSFNIALPDSREGFRDMVEAVDLTTESGRAMLVALLNLAPAAAAAFDLLESQQQGYFGAFYSDAERAAMSVDSVRAEFEKAGVTLPGTREAFRAVVDGIDVTTEAGRKLKEQMLALAGSADTLYTAQESVLQSQLDVLNGAVTASMSAVQRAVTAEKNSITTAYNARVASLNDMVSTAQESISGLTSITNALDSALKALNGTSDDAVRMMRAQAKATVDSALAIARAGGSLSGFEGLEDALGVISDNDTSLYSSLEDFNREQGRNANLVAELNGITGKQLTADQQLLKTVQDQIKAAKTQYDDEMLRLDQQLELAQAQIDALNGIDNSVLSVRDAMAQLAASIAAATAANAAKAATAAAGGGYVGTGTAGAPSASDINAIYQQVLGRDADVSGYTYWAGQLGSGVSDLAAAIRADAIKNGEIQAHAAGGFITGPGTGTSDSILSWLSNGEYVMSARAVQMFGTGLLDQMNAGRLPGFATGGGVGETGPVLQITRPSQIYAAQPAQGQGGRDSDAALLAELRQLRADIHNDLRQIAKYNEQTASTVRSMRDGGLEINGTVMTKAVSA